MIIVWLMLIEPAAIMVRVAATPVVLLIPADMVMLPGCAKLPDV